MGNVETKRLVLVLLQEFQSVLVDEVGGVALFRGLLAPVPPVVLHVIAPVVDVIDVPTVIAHEVIKAVVLRMIVRVLARVAQMPLSHQAGGITGFLEQLREGDLGLLQALAVLGVVGARMNDRFDAHPLLVTPREQAGPGGGTHRAATVKVGEEHTLAGQAVHARRLVMGIAVRSDGWACKPHVVDHHDHDVGFRFGCPDQEQQSGKQAESKGRSYFHWVYLFGKNQRNDEIAVGLALISGSRSFSGWRDT